MSSKELTESELYFKCVTDRVLLVLNSSKQAAVSDALGMSSSDFANRKKRGRIPYENLVAFAASRNVSIDWLLTGQGEMQRGVVGIQEAIPIYKAAGALDKREEAVLTLFRALDEDAQREIQQVAEEKKRLRDVEQHIKELQTELAEVKKLA